MTASWQESYGKPRQCVEKQRLHSADKGPCSQGYGLLSGHVQLWELDCKEGRVPNNWCLWTGELEKTLENPLDRKGIKAVHLKGNRPWILIGQTDAEAEAPIFWSSDEKQPTHWKSLWCLERLKVEGEEGIKGWDAWMESPIQWTWTWANFRRWWGTGRPGVLQPVGLQRVGHNWTTEKQQQHV